MDKFLSILLLFLFMFLPSTVGAMSKFTGNDFLAMWEVERTKNQCVMYVAGVIDGATYEAQYAKREGFTLKTRISQGDICIPQNVTSAEYTKVVVKYFKDNPKMLTVQAGVLVRRALWVNYPCQNN